MPKLTRKEWLLSVLGVDLGDAADQVVEGRAPAFAYSGNVAAEDRESSPTAANPYAYVGETQDDEEREDEEEASRAEYAYGSTPESPYASDKDIEEDARADVPDDEEEEQEEDEQPLLRRATGARPASPEETPGTGLKGKPLGEKYRGEEEGKGWQVDRNRKTRYYDDAKRAASAVSFDDDGTAHNQEEGKLKNERGFVMDPATGALHTFDQNRPFEKDSRDQRNVNNHHSTPLAGGDVAAAGIATFEKGRLTHLLDESGHYKPGAAFTHQAVRFLDQSKLSAAIRDKLKKAGADTVHQLVAAEIQVQRVAMSEAIDARQQAILSERMVPEGLPADEARRWEAELWAGIDAERRQIEKDFAAAARAVEQDILREFGQSAANPLVDSRLTDLDGDRPEPEDMPPEAARLLKLMKVVGKELQKAQTAEVRAPLLRQIDQLGAELVKFGYAPAARETTIGLLGKQQISEEEYEAAKQGRTGTAQEKAEQLTGNVNRAVALNQLRVILGNEAYGKLLMSNKGRTKEEEQTALSRKMAEIGARTADEAKAILGEQAVKAIENDHDKIDELARRYKLTNLKKESAIHGPDWAGLEVGRNSSLELTKSQFLQTEGNEDQARSKVRMQDELQARTSQERERLDTEAEDRATRLEDDGKQARKARKVERAKEASELADEISANPAIRARLVKDARKEIDELAGRHRGALEDLDRLQEQFSKAEAEIKIRRSEVEAAEENLRKHPGDGLAESFLNGKLDLLEKVLRQRDGARDALPNYRRVTESLARELAELQKSYDDRFGTASNA